MSDGAKYFLFASFIHIFPVHRKFCISALFFCHNMWHLRMQCIHKVLVNFNVEYFWSVNIKYCVYHHSFVNIKLVFLWIFTLCLSFECHLELFMLWLRLEPTFQRFDLSNAESFCFILKKKNAKFCRNYDRSKVVVTANACNCTVYIMSQKFDQIWK